MTVNTADITSGPYAGNGVADSFSFDFRIENKNQLYVWETNGSGVQTLLTVDTDYTVSGVGNDAGGTVTRVAGALPSGYEWYIRSKRSSVQNTAFASQGGFFPWVHEEAFDHLTYLVQQLDDRLNRTVRTPLGDSTGGFSEIPVNAADRANTLLYFDNNGDVQVTSYGQADVEVNTNKATDFSNVNNTLYPTTQAVADYVAVAGGGNVSAADSPVDGSLPLWKSPNLVGTMTPAEARSKIEIFESASLSEEVAIFGTDPTKLKSTGRKWTQQPLVFKDVFEFAAYNKSLLVDEQPIEFLQFWTSTGIGSIKGKWSSTEPVANHNGITIRDPAKVSELNNTNKTFGTYFTADTVSGDTGCFVASAPKGWLNVEWSGAGDFATLGNNPCGVAIQAANNTVEQEGRPGGILVFPKGFFQSEISLRVGGWVTWLGAGTFSSSIAFTNGVSGNLITLGPDESGEFSYSGSYAFGSRIEQIDINAGDVYRGLDSATIYTVGAHQNSGISKCQIRGVVTTAILYDLGTGAPAGFHIEDVNIQGSAVAPTTGTKRGIVSNAGGALLNLARVQLETDNTDPWDNAILMLKDHLRAEDVHIEGAVNGINLSQSESTVRGATLTNVTGRSDVATLVRVSSTNNVEYTLTNVNNTTISGASIDTLVDAKLGRTIGGVNGAHISNFTNAPRKGGKTVASATGNYSVTSSALQAGENVDSVTKESTGSFLVNLKEPVLNQNMVIGASVRYPGGAPGFYVPTPLSTSQFRLELYNTSGTLADPDRFTFIVFDG